MADTFTANYNWTKPQVGGDPDTWGGLLNTDLDGIDSTVFAVSGVANGALPKTGGVITGNSSIAPASGDASFTINKATAGLNALLIGQTNGVTRWAAYMGNGSAESGSNNGSDFALARFSDAGAFIDSPISIARVNGAVTIPNTLTVGGITQHNNSVAITTTGAGGLTVSSSNTGPASINLVNSSTSGRSWSLFSAGSAGVAGVAPVGSLGFYDNTGGGVRAYINSSGEWVFLTNGSSKTITISDSGAGAGANLRLLGNGTTTPSKYIRVINGVLGVVNDAYTAGILSGTDAGIWSAPDFQATSDRRLKTNIEDFAGGIEELCRIRVYEYDKHLVDASFAAHEVGVIAQEIAEILPSAVHEGADGFLTVSDRQLLALAINAIQDIASALRIQGIL